MIASHNGHANMVAYLLGKGAIVDKLNNDGFTALDRSDCAARGNHADIVGLLL